MARPRTPQALGHTLGGNLGLELVYSRDMAIANVDGDEREMGAFLVFMLPKKFNA
jgi:hypothetical protein